MCSTFGHWAHWGYMAGHILNVFNIWSLGISETHVVCVLNVFSMYPLGILALVPSVNVMGIAKSANLMHGSFPIVAPTYRHHTQWWIRYPLSLDLLNYPGLMDFLRLQHVHLSEWSLWGSNTLMRGIGIRIHLVKCITMMLYHWGQGYI